MALVNQSAVSGEVAHQHSEACLTNCSKTTDRVLVIAVQTDGMTRTEVAAAVQHLVEVDFDRQKEEALLDQIASSAVKMIKLIEPYFESERRTRYPMPAHLKDPPWAQRRSRKKKR